MGRWPGGKAGEWEGCVLVWEGGLAGREGGRVCLCWCMLGATWKIHFIGILLVSGEFMVSLGLV